MQSLRYSRLLISAVLLIVTSCNSKERPSQINDLAIKAAMKSYDAAIQAGIRGRSYPGEFNKLFPGAFNGISYYSGLVGTPSWYGRAGLCQRYVLKMQLDVHLDSARVNITSTGRPSFYLYEFRSVTFLPSGAPKVQGQQLATLSADDWRRLFDADGDFRVLGITLKTNEPVEGFAAALDQF
jgi:hypothetical protein